MSEAKFKVGDRVILTTHCDNIYWPINHTFEITRISYAHNMEWLYGLCADKTEGNVDAALCVLYQDKNNFNETLNRVPLMIKPVNSNPCTCTSLHIRDFGCTCGHIERYKPKYGL